MKKALLVFFGIFICLMFFLVADFSVNSASRAARAGTIVSCWGDSITLGYAYQPVGQDYPRRLQKLLDAAYGSGSYTIINRGVNSYRADQVLAKTLTWLAADNPNIVLLMVGTNDMTHGQTIESTRGEVQGIINLVSGYVNSGEVQGIINSVRGHINPDGSSPRIIVSAIIPTLTSESWLMGVYNDDLAAHLGGRVYWFTSNWDDFYDSGSGLAKAWLMANDLHPNSDGYKVMAENWFDAIASLPENQPPDVPSSPSGPSSGDPGVSYSFSSTTADPNDNQIAFQFDWGDGIQSNWSSFVQSGGSVTMSHSWSGQNTFRVKARAKNSHDEQSDWSAAHEITIGQPPGTPAAPTGPDSGSPDTSYSFSATATDPNEDQIAFQFDWGDGIQSNWSSFVQSGGSVTMSHSWSGKGSYQVRVRVKDSHGDISGWSIGHLVVISTVVLGVDPLSLSFGNMGTGSSKTMTFRIYNSGDGTLSGTISTDSNWISVDPTSFEGNEHNISATVNTEGLAESTTLYSGIVTVTSSNGGTKTINISVAVIPGGAVIYPNPFSLSSHASLTFWGISVAHAKIQIFTLAGKLVKTLEEIYGANKVSWDGRNEKGVKVATGVYVFVVGSYSGKIAIVE